MIFKNAIYAAISITNLLVLPAQGHFFWVNVRKDTGEVEVTFSEKAGVPDAAILHLKDKINGNGFRLSAMYFGVDGEGQYSRSFQPIEWDLDEEAYKITGLLPETTFEPSSTSVTGRLDMGPFNKYGMDVDDLQQLFSSNQLRNKEDQLKVSAHEHMKEKPFYVALEGCNSEITATVHGLSTSIDTEPISVCFYEIGGNELGCEDANDADDDAAIARIATDLDTTTTIFAKAHAMFESEGGKGIAKHATVSADYGVACSL